MTGVAQTSIESYHSEDVQAKKGTQQERILRVLQYYPALCNRDIARITQMEIGSVTARCNELEKAQKIKLCFVGTHEKTRKSVKCWELVQ